MSTELTSNNYNKLRETVLEVLDVGKARARLAVDRETVRTYWEVGRLLSEAGVTVGEGGTHGAGVISRLSGDLGVRERLLYEMIQLHQYFPYLPTSAKIGWSHYRVLLGVASEADRRLYLESASRAGWSVRELRGQVKSGALALAHAQPEAADPGPRRSRRAGLPALRGELFTYRLVTDSGEGSVSDLRLDLGFGIRLAVQLGGLPAAQEGVLVRARKGPSGSFEFEEAQERRASFYTYGARVLRVVDGDTLWLDIDCGFRVWTRQKVRLRGIDAPELPTAEGLRAKEFVAGTVNHLACVAVTTTRPDKYGRYLADIFTPAEGGSAQDAASAGRYLNRALLDAGLAVRV